VIPAGGTAAWSTDLDAARIVRDRAIRARARSDAEARSGLLAPPDPTDGCNLSAGKLCRRSIHCQHQLGCRKQCIVALVHRGGPRVVRDAGNGRLPPVNADDALDDANVGTGTLERTSLLDVQLQVGASSLRLRRRDR